MKTNRRSMRALLSGGAVVCVAYAAPSYCDEPTLEIERIVVTAQKREEALEQVPIAVAVVSGESVARMNLRNLEEISVSTPGFHIQQSPAQSGIYIRSIASRASNQGFEQSVGLFVDGVYAGRERLFQAPLLDIERVEILKGPQSLILGKNTTAGAVNITTARPTEHRESSVSAQYGEHDEYAATAIYSGPLANGLSARVAARVSGAGGYLRNTFKGTDEVNTKDEVVRGSVKWQAGPDTVIYAKAEYAQSRQLGNTLAVSRLTPAQLAAARIFDPELSADVGSLQKSADGAGLPHNEEYNDLTSYNFTVTADHGFADWLLTSVSAFGHLDYAQGTDADHQPSPRAVVALQVASDYDQLSEELRIASPIGKTFEFMGGGYYQTADVHFTDWIPCVSFAAVPGVGRPAAFCAPARWQQDQASWSGFSRVTWNVTNAFRLNAGVRYTAESKVASNRLTITELDGKTPNADPFDLQIARVVGGWATHTIPRTKRTEENWSPSYSAQYDATPGVMLYASVTRGTKGGGFNPLDGTGALSAWQFSPETAKSYEGGVKSKLWDNRAALNLAVFSSRFENLQVSQFNGVTFAVTNAGSAKVTGVELDFRARATARVTLGGNVSYLHSRYGTFTTAPCKSGQTAATGCVGGFQDLSGAPLPFAADWTAALEADYTRPIAGFVLSLHGDAFYTGEHFLAQDNDPRAVQSGYTKLNARVALGKENGRWEIAAVGKNLTDEITKGFENDIIGHPGGFFAQVYEGRSLSLQGTMRF